MTTATKPLSKMGTPLPFDFQPGPYDVICAKGKAAREHEGNMFFRRIIKETLSAYGKADSRYKKSMIVSDVVDLIRSRSRGSQSSSSSADGSSSSCGGGFVKRDGNDGLYYEVGDRLAREKVGQSFRDGLSDMYRSSARAKKRRQRIVSAGVADEFEALLKRDSFVSRRIRTLQDTAKFSVERQILLGGIRDEEERETDSILSLANLEILEAFKRNDELLQKFNDSECVHKASTSRFEVM